MIISVLFHNVWLCGSFDNDKKIGNGEESERMLQHQLEYYDSFPTLKPSRVEVILSQTLSVELAVVI